jgi:hypothetical protein
MRAIPQNQDGFDIPRSRLLADALSVFVQHGWDVKVVMSQNAQLEKRRGVRPVTGAVMIGAFSVLGLAAYVVRLATARRERVHLHVHSERGGEGALQVLHGGKNLLISNPAELAAIARSENELSLTAALGLGLATVIFWALVAHLL